MTTASAKDDDNIGTDSGKKIITTMLSTERRNRVLAGQVVARTLGDLVRKLGQRVLQEIIPVLEKGLDSDGKGKRQGVCVSLSEIMNSTLEGMVLTFVDSLVPTVRYEYYFHQRPSF